MEAEQIARPWRNEIPTEGPQMVVEALRSARRWVGRYEWEEQHGREQGAREALSACRQDLLFALAWVEKASE